MNRLNVRFQHMTHGLRNSIERWFALVKAKTKRFHNSFPYRSSIGSLKSWAETFTQYYSLDWRIVHIEEVLS